MRRDLLHFDLPAELIASRPAEDRDGARLLLVDRALPPGEVAHAHIRDLEQHIPEGALVVVNDTRVILARLLGRKRTSGGQVELLLVRKLADEPASTPTPAERWSALGRASKPIRPGADLDFGEPGTLSAHVLASGGGMLEVRLSSPAGLPLAEALDACGHIPLPPYLRRADDGADRERYQTIFARTPGAIAAPTAGLHLSERLVERLRARGVRLTSITLHVGLGTFQPVTVDDLDEHPMHEEQYLVSDEARAAIADARTRGAPVVAIGTTVVRTLESAADPERPGHVLASAGETRLLIQPGYRFRVVDALLTNFHLPESTLLALVCAFAGVDRALAAYRAAIAARYHFYSYGDAMLISGKA
ncbi:tRNA preQ1(34) S-adenosylmethionine ribosyltransferase-isomerase QueA [Chondromyces apiculatus]|uniref:S-adenosylmethionine:tRNA ribosyltransferase-isomerase n=1 Tax=Chondromyces apiculatus DSM 436 TaxID=1192034 RepID=A0A017SZK1_9BACT|nr:tRNA preQ1(34) S-adenosylmethionine ribosyltransferase-isomerase QueA [Chondromyces apiculatus]EYF02398.1 S-adenosylmethionine:tRNA ribosyltransferase-isomerase [Chondromyces apiculatus DSM 436]